MTQPIDFPLPPNQPRPLDRGAAELFKGLAGPKIAMPSTSGREVDYSELNAPRTVV